MTRKLTEIPQVALLFETMDACLTAGLDVPHDVAVLAVDNDEMTCVYTEPHFDISYIKRFTFGGAIQNKDYRLSPEKSVVQLLEEGTPETIYLKYKPSKGQKIHQQVFTPSGGKQGTGNL